jgi:hypothetical protein
MIFKLYNSDLGIKVNGVSYEFEHVDNLQIEDPEVNRLVRGSNAGNKIGLSYKEGLKEPKRITVNIMGMSQELKAVLDGCFESQTRIEVYCIDRIDGSSKVAKEAILSTQPMQLNLDDTPESMVVALAFESFDLVEVHKS